MPPKKKSIKKPAKKALRLRSGQAKKKPVRRPVKKKPAKKRPAKKAPAKKRAPAKKQKAKEAPPVSVRVSKAKTPGLLRGMKDILPKEEYFWKKMHHLAENLAQAYGYGYLETPVLEEAALFIRSIGRGTDVVEKEMYMFEDRDGSKIALRPEFTASVARAYIIHGMHSYPQPVKVWSWGPLFRHDRPQAGRFRQFHQFNCEVFGERDPVVEAELIVVAYNFLKDLGINSNVYINSIGTLEERQNYIIELVGYLRTKRAYLCSDCKKRINKNPLRVLDCKQEQCQPIIEEAPQIIDWLSDDSRFYFMKVVEYLDDLEIPYMVKPTLVRGLDYYSETVFEFYLEEGGEQGAQSALGGGGRYDLLVEQLGGKETPACGFSLGLERVVSAMRKLTEGEEDKYQEDKLELFFAHLGEQARRRMLYILEDLRKNGIIVYHNLAKFALKGQLELADKYKVPYTLILGQKEVQDGTIIIRDMESGIQEIIDQKKLKTALQKKLKLI